MAYLLGRGTAVEWLRHNQDAGLFATRYALPMLSLEASRRRLQRHASHTADLTRPLRIIVSLRESRRPSAEAVCHLLTTPDGTYPAIRVKRGLFCSAPDFAFVQMANELDEEALRFLGMELCGRYGIDANGRLFLRPQCCMPDALRTCAERLRGTRGRKRALAVAPLVWAGAASPMESALALILCSSPETGGFGMAPPELNRALPVTGRARDLWDDDFITPDLYWEQGHLAIEYDSDLHHGSSHRIAHDSSRRNVLAELGLRVISVTAEHMRTPRELERIAGIVARQLGCELPPCDEDEWGRRVAFQLRMRTLAEQPEALLGFSDKAVASRRAWHVRNRSR